jgi:hypothetical protein
MSASLPDKPSRRFSKGWTTTNIVACWAALAASMWLGRDMAAIVVPIMATLIAALLGVYQAIGHFDLRALAQLAGRPAKGASERRRAPKPEGGAG